MKQIQIIPHQLCILIAILLSLTGHLDAHIKSIKAQTKEGLSLTVWVDKQSIRLGKNIELRFRVENKSNKVVYLVKKENLEIETKKNRIVVNPFTVGPDEIGSTDYSFLPIRKGGHYQGTFVVPAQKIDEDGVWLIEVGFAFVDNIQNLQPRNALNSDPVLFRGLLVQRATPIKLGQLYVVIE